MAENDIYRFTLSAGSVDALRDFLRGNRLDLGCRPIVKEQASRYSIDAFATESEMRLLQQSRTIPAVAIERRENVSSEGRAARTELVRLKRASVRPQMPRGLGSKE